MIIKWGICLCLFFIRRRGLANDDCNCVADYYVEAFYGLFVLELVDQLLTINGDFC